MVKVNNVTSMLQPRPKTPNVVTNEKSALTPDIRQDAFSSVSQRLDVQVRSPASTSSGHKPAPVVKTVATSRPSDVQKAYMLAAQKRHAPSSDEGIPVESEHRAFNHTHEYAVADDYLWFRRHGDKAWQPMYFDGFAKGEIPVSVDCDGANLIVIDDKNKLHYKKVLTEFRGSELDFERNADLKAARAQIEGCPYVAVDTNEQNNWEDKWFSLPVVHHVVNLFAGKRLTLPSNAKAVAISHRGRYNDYVEDKCGQRHPVSTGVTTLYVLDANGQDIHKYDPWSPKWAKTSISLPENARTAFVANHISASASTIMAVGYETDLASGKQTLKIITRLADIDTEGGNPALKYSYFKDEADCNRRVLPIDNKWQEHPISLKDKAMVTKRITILQSGEGNRARELRIEGTNAKGEWGYYKKSLQDTDWTFVSTSPAQSHGIQLAPPKRDQISSSVRDYQGTLGSHKASMHDFGKRSNHAQISLEVDGKKYQLDLYKRFSLVNFLGIKGSKYELVIPDDNPDLKKIFGNDKVIKVRVKKKPGEVKICSPILSRHRFQFCFK